MHARQDYQAVRNLAATDSPKEQAVRLARPLQQGSGQAGLAASAQQCLHGDSCEPAGNRARARFRRVDWPLLGSTLILVGLLLGCSNPPSPPQDTSAAPRAGEVFQRMLAAYREAKTYQDQGELTLSYTQRGTPQKETVSMSLAVERPNKLRARAYQLDIASDGSKLRALIKDDTTKDLGRQILVRPLAKDALLNQILSDTVVSDVLLGGRGGVPVPLELMLSDQPLADFHTEEFEKTLLDGDVIDGQPCFQLRIASPKLEFHFWIDKESFLVRRIDYPASRFAAELLKSPEAKGVKLSAFFRSAKVGTAIPANEFNLPTPKDFQEVSFFVVPPPQIPSPLIGETAGDFFFTDTSNNRISREYLAGKITALVWFHDDLACEQYMQEFNRVADRFQDDDEIAFYAVFTKPRRFTNVMLDDLAKKWDLQMPVVRDLQAFGRDLFHVPVAPTLIVLDKKSRIHIFEAEANLKIAEQLPTVLRELRAGKDIAAEVVGYYDKLWKTYQQNLLSATGQGQPQQVESQLLPKTDPQHLVIKEEWSLKLKNPGNILLTKGQNPSCFVVQDGRQVVQLDHTGKQVAEHPLSLSSGETVSFLRGVTSKDGKHLYALWRFGGPRLLVYDDQWKLLLSYPASDEKHGGINDVQITDMENDGTIEAFVGFWELAGLHRVDMQGNRKWGFRGIQNIYSVALSPRNVVGWQKVLTCGEKGTLHRLNQFGAADSVISVPGRAIHHLFGSDFEAPEGAIYCGISLTAQGQAVGLNADMQEAWFVPLAAGTFAGDVQFVTSARLWKGPGQWLLAGPDGTITIVSADGQFADRIAFGKPIRGLAAATIDGRAMLLISTPEQVTGYTLKQKDAPE